MTLLGTRPESAPALGRSAARPGDALWVGATLGESAAGRRLLARGARAALRSDGGLRVILPEALRRPRRLAEAARQAVVRHLEPRPQLELGAWLGSRERAAAIDLSDGLARDLPRLARESGVGAEVEADLLPFSEGFEELCAALGEDPIDLALGGGEDYALLFALPENEAPPGRFEGARVGRVTENERLALIRSGRRERWPEIGWDHFG